MENLKCEMNLQSNQIQLAQTERDRLKKYADMQVKAKSAEDQVVKERLDRYKTELENKQNIYDLQVKLKEYKICLS